MVKVRDLTVDSPLRGMPNVFLSPHIAGVTDAASGATTTPPRSAPRKSAA